MGKITLDPAAITVKQNTDTTYVVLLEDRARLILIEYKDLLQQKVSWVAPAGIALSVLLTMVSADFNETFGIPASMWQGFFLFALLASLIWLIKELLRLYHNSRLLKRRSAVTYILEQMHKYNPNNGQE